MSDLHTILPEWEQFFSITSPLLLISSCWVDIRQLYWRPRWYSGVLLGLVLSKTISFGLQVRESESFSPKKHLCRPCRRQPHPIHRIILEVSRHCTFTIEWWTFGFLTPPLTVIDEWLPRGITCIIFLLDTKIDETASQINHRFIMVINQCHKGPLKRYDMPRWGCSWAKISGLR
jgi:hypothetical protein